jgi:hypothetical protein
MDNIIEGMKEKTYWPEKNRNNRTANIIEEDGFIIEVVADTEASKQKVMRILNKLL